MPANDHQQLWQERTSTFPCTERKTRRNVISVIPFEAQMMLLFHAVIDRISSRTQDVKLRLLHGDERCLANLFKQLPCSLALDSVFRVMWCMQTCPRYKHSRIYVTQGCTFNKEKAPGKNDPAERQRQKQAREVVISQNAGSPSPGLLAIKVGNVNSPFF